jgi:hypothetical protein
LSGGRHDLDGAGVVGDGHGVAGGVAGWDDGDGVVDEVGGVQVPAVGVPAGATARRLGRVPARIELTVNVPAVIAVTSAPAACPT